MPMIDLDSLELLKGSHMDRNAGVCLLEAVAWFAGEPHSDRPACVCTVLAAFGRSWNDSLDMLARQKLKAYIPRMIGTANDGAADQRAWMAMEWLIRVCTPEFLDAAGLTAQAASLRGLPEIRDQQSLKCARPMLADASRAAAVAGYVARAAAAARATGVDASWAAAYSAAKAAARAADWTAAGDAPRFAAKAAGKFTGYAAGAKLAPVVARLQASAFDLFDRMIEARKEENVCQ